MNKYEVRMKATFYNDGKIVKTLTMIDIVEGQDMTMALKQASNLVEELVTSFMDNNGPYQDTYEKILRYIEVDDIDVEVSAIVPYSG